MGKCIVWLFFCWVCWFLQWMHISYWTGRIVLQFLVSGLLNTGKAICFSSQVEVCRWVWPGVWLLWHHLYHEKGPGYFHPRWYDLSFQIHWLISASLRLNTNDWQLEGCWARSWELLSLCPWGRLLTPPCSPVQWCCTVAWPVWLTDMCDHHSIGCLWLFCVFFNSGNTSHVYDNSSPLTIAFSLSPDVQWEADAVLGPLSIQ